MRVETPTNTPKHERNTPLAKRRDYGFQIQSKDIEMTNRGQNADEEEGSCRLLFKKWPRCGTIDALFHEANEPKYTWQVIAETGGFSYNIWKNSRSEKMSCRSWLKLHEVTYSIALPD